MRKKMMTVTVVLLTLQVFTMSLSHGEASREMEMNSRYSFVDTGNLLINSGFENGSGNQPDGWTTFPSSAPGISYIWCNETSHSGNRCVCIKSTGSSFGMWQQIVPVEGNVVYVLNGFLGFQDLQYPGRCNLQLVFRDSSNNVVQLINYPSHSGTREFAFDFPVELKVRAPDEAETVEVNLFMQGHGKAFFDDIYFGMAPTGTIKGKVTSNGVPLKGAAVSIQGSPWGKKYECTTNVFGEYVIPDVPVAFPRYILLASKPGYVTQSVGRVAVKENGVTTVNFDLTSGRNPLGDLRVKVGTLSFQPFETPPSEDILDAAVIPEDESGYPESVKPFLLPSEYITSDNPRVIEKAFEIYSNLSTVDRRRTREVAWAVYEWICKNIEYDGVFIGKPGGLNQPYRDVTSGIWQTISGSMGGDGWGWGNNFSDWAYKPEELLEVRCGICVEHARLGTALLRALNIPARATSGSLEFWAQDENGSGAWFGMSTSAGRTSYRENGMLGPGFATRGLEMYPVTEKHMQHEDWNALRRGLWRESHPWKENYPGTSEGFSQALTDLKKFASTGNAPRGEHVEPGSDRYSIDYRDITLNLCDFQKQRTLVVRFPTYPEPGVNHSIQTDFYWTNCPECVKRTWIEEVRNPPVEGKERWFCIEFDLSPLFEENVSFNVDIVKPKENYLYIFGREIISLPVTTIIGGVDVEVRVNRVLRNVTKVEFYIDNKLKFVDEEEPYNWLWNEFAIGSYEIKVVAYDDNENRAQDEIDVIMFNVGGR